MSLEQRYTLVKKKLFDRFYKALNEKQREAVYKTQGPLLVLAGAGSGKTTVLVQRIAHIIKFGKALDTDEIPQNALNEAYISMLEKVADDENCDKSLLESALNSLAITPAKPYEILSITFTNKAAGEMKERLEKRLGEGALDIWAGTFHSVCARFLRMYIDRLGRDSSFTIYDTDDQKKLMTTCIKELDLNDKMFTPKAVLSEISRCKENLVSLEEYKEDISKSDIRRQTLARLFELYESKKLKANALDFDDMITLTVKIFRENPDVLQKNRDRFKYILVDEYQDTNKAQFELCKFLCSEEENIMVVGDDDQSIYKFRGATIENILGFDTVFKRARVVKLEQNYRSTDVIIGAANEVIKNNTGRKGKTLWTKSEGGDKITVKQCENQNHEAQYIVDRISDLVAKGDYSFSDFAILYRTNAQSNALETVFAKSGIPYRILGSMRFYDRKEIKDIISYLCVIANPNDAVRVKRIINTPKRGIGDATVEEVERLATLENVDMIHICTHADKYPTLSRSAGKLCLFAQMIREFKEDAKTLTLGVLTQKIYEKSGYRDMLLSLDEAEGKDRQENIKELLNNASQYQENSGGVLQDEILNGFLEEVALISDIDNYDKDAPAVVMMTIHSAKGLEFPVVFLPGLEENIFPGVQSTLYNDELEEERRLCYVAITRAKKKLFILHCASRLTYGKTEFNRKSRFVDEIPETFCEYEDKFLDRKVASQESFMSQGKSYFTKSGGDYFSQKPYFTRNAPSSQTSTPAVQKRESFKIGDAVTHAIFGDGFILNTKQMGPDTLYEVAFDKVGTKKMMESSAKLSKKI